MDVFELLLEYATTLVMSCHSLTNPKTPQRPATFRKSIECQYCDFRERCWGEIDVATMPASEYAERFAEAEKTAAELIAQRPQFYGELLENCTPSIPHGKEDELKVLISAAYKKAVTEWAAQKKRPSIRGYPLIRQLRITGSSVRSRASTKELHI